MNRYQLAVVAPTLAWLALAALKDPGSFGSLSVFVWMAAVGLVDLMAVEASGMHLTLSFPILLAVAMIYRPSVAGGIALVGSIDRREMRRTISMLKALFVRSQIALAVAAGSAFFHTFAFLGSPWKVLVPVLIGAIVVDSAVNSLLVGVYVHLASDVSLSRVLSQMRIGSRSGFLFSYLVLALSGLVMARLYLHEGLWAGLAAVAPLIFARRTFLGGQALREASTRYRSLVEHLPAIAHIGALGDEAFTIHVSPQLRSLLGFEEAEWYGNPDLWAQRLHPDDRDRVLAEAGRAEEQVSRFTSEYRMLAKDGGVIWIHHESDALGGHGTDRPLRQGVMLDITAQKTAEEQVMFLGRHDRLTGLPNRITFEQLLEESLDRARRHHQGLAILHIDVDSLNVVNGNLGYSAGDELLVQVAARIEGAVRDCDVVARHGGDEFLVLLCDLELPAGTTITAAQTAREVAARIQEAVKAPFETEGEEFYLTLSMGVSIYPLDARKGPELLRNADDAMNRSKRQGPGGMVIQSSNGSAVLGQLSMATRLRKAVQLRQWVLHYQPIVDLADGRVWGVESLVRWEDPDHGLLLPAAFLPLAEAMGLTEDLGDWVIEEALHQAGRWHADGLRIQTTFNLSPRQLKRQDLLKRILGTLESAGVEPSTCTVEVTEQAVAGGGEETDRVLGELHDAGIRIALDDFGTGHSSLSRLREFPVDILKIDRSFVCDLPRARDASEMVTAIIRLALSLGIEPIAEGIETEGQRTFLLGQGCQMGQGFLFSRPEPADVVTGLLSGVLLASD